MRSSGRVFVAGVVIALCAAAGVAAAAEREPVTGGLLSLPGAAAPAPAPVAQAPAQAPASWAGPALAPAPPEPPATRDRKDDTTWGLLIRGGVFDLPGVIKDALFIKHPEEIDGPILGAEIRYHGEDGGRGAASIGVSFDSVTATGTGEWQHTDSKRTMIGYGEVTVMAVTVTGYWSLLPSWYVHPTIGIGIGVAHATGHYQDDADRNQWVDADYWIPAVHVPVGLAIELGKGLQLTIEGRFIDGISIGASLQARI